MTSETPREIAKRIVSRLGGESGRALTAAIEAALVEARKSGERERTREAVWRKRAEAAEAKLAERDREWLNAMWPDNADTTLGEEILRGGPSFAAAVREHDRELQAADISEARRKGMEEMRERAAKAAEEHLYHVDLPGYGKDGEVIDDGGQNHEPEPGDPPRCCVANMLRALPLEPEGEGGKG